MCPTPVVADKSQSIFKSHNDPTVPLRQPFSMERVVGASKLRPSSHALLTAAAFQAALVARPELCLAAAPPSSFHDSIMRTSSTMPQPGSLLDSRTCSLPFQCQMDVPESLLPVIGLQKITLRLNIAMGALCKFGQTPVPVLVRAAPRRPAAGALAAAPTADPPASLRALYFRDDAAGGGWVISEAHWARQSEKWRSGTQLGKAPRLSATGLAIHKSYVESHSAGPGAPTPSSLGSRSRPGAARPAPSDTMTEAPSEFLSALSCSSARMSASSAFELTDGLGPPAPPLLSRGLSGPVEFTPWSPMNLVAPVPQAVAAAGAIAEAVVAPPGSRSRAPLKFLRGASLAAALALHPNLSLLAYNGAPSISPERLGSVFIRTSAAAPASGAEILASLCSAPFVSVAVPPALVPLIGLVTIQHPWQRALDAWHRESKGASPVSVLVPIADRDMCDGTEAECVPIATLRPMLYIPDAPSTVVLALQAPSDSGWLVFEQRWLASASAASAPAQINDGSGLPPVAHRSLRSAHQELLLRLSAEDTPSEARPSGAAAELSKRRRPETAPRVSRGAYAFPPNTLSTMLNGLGSRADAFSGGTDIAGATAGLLGMTLPSKECPRASAHHTAFDWPPSIDAMFSADALSSAFGSDCDPALRMCCSPRSVDTGHMAAALALLKSSEEPLAEQSFLSDFLIDAADSTRLTGYNAAPTIRLSKLPAVVMRCAGTPSPIGRRPGGYVVDPDLCAAPMLGTDVPANLVELLQVGQQGPL